MSRFIGTALTRHSLRKNVMTAEAEDSVNETINSVIKMSHKRKSSTVRSVGQTGAQTYKILRSVDRPMARIKAQNNMKSRISCRFMSSTPEEYEDIFRVGNGFHHKWKAVEVFGLLRSPFDGQVLALVDWKGKPPTLELAQEANQQIPHLMIAYYEKRIYWRD